MKLATGTVIQGQVVVEGDTPPEGLRVSVHAREDDDSCDGPAELEAELQESLRLRAGKPSRLPKFRRCMRRGCWHRCCDVANAVQKSVS